MIENEVRTYVRTPDIVQAFIKCLHDTYHISYREIAKIAWFEGIPPGTINAIAKHGYIPKKWYSKLHIQLPVEVMPCPLCNVVHIGKCPQGVKKYKRTPGKWINLSDPGRTARALYKGVQYPIKVLIAELEFMESHDYSKYISAMANAYATKRLNELLLKGHK